MATKYTLILLAISISVSGLIEFVENWVWSPAWTIFLFLGVYFTDWITAVWLSIKRGGAFETKRTMKAIIVFFTIWFVLIFMHNTPKIIEEYIAVDAIVSLTKMIPGILFTYIVLVTFASSVKNFVLLGYLKNKYARFVYRYIDVYKNQIEDVLSDRDTKQGK